MFCKILQYTMAILLMTVNTQPYTRIQLDTNVMHLNEIYDAL